MTKPSDLERMTKDTSCEGRARGSADARALWGGRAPACGRAARLILVKLVGAKPEEDDKEGVDAVEREEGDAEDEKIEGLAQAAEEGEVVRLHRVQQRAHKPVRARLGLVAARVRGELPPVGAEGEAVAQDETVAHLLLDLGPHRLEPVGHALLEAVRHRRVDDHLLGRVAD